MAVARRLGQTGGARGENQQGRRLRIDVRANIAREQCARGVLDARIKMPVYSFEQRSGPRGFRVVDQPAGHVRQTLGGLHIGQAFFANHQSLGLGGLQRMQQRFAADLGVDKGHHHTEFDQAKPGAEKRRAILHDQRAHVASAQTIGVERMGHLIGPCVDFAITQALLAVDQERSLALRLRLLFKAVGQSVKVTGLDQPGSGRTHIQQRLSLLPWYRASGQHTGQGIQAHCATSCATACQVG